MRPVGALLELCVDVEGFESARPTWLTTHLTSKPFASSAIEMWVRRSVCGVVVGTGGLPCAARSAHRHAIPRVGRLETVAVNARRAEPVRTKASDALMRAVSWTSRCG